MPAKKTTAKTPDAPATLSQADVDAICRLIDHAKAAGIAFFEGPAGLKFGFRRESLRPQGTQIPGSLPRESGDDFIP